MLLKKNLLYSPFTGAFIDSKGKAVGSNMNGYIRITRNGKHLAHRLAWEYVYGKIPEGKQIDHIDGDKKNNRIFNLRLVEPFENSQNKKNSSQYKGVKKLGDNRFIALLKLKGKEIYLGSYSTYKKAHEVYINKKKELHPFHKHDPLKEGNQE